MRLLADTHILLWWLADDPHLSALHRMVISDPANGVYFSAISIAEIAIKTSLGKLEAPSGIVDTLKDGEFSELPFLPEHAEELRDLPWLHRDPFDRMLVAQARTEGMGLLTVDARIQEYEVAFVHPHLPRLDPPQS